MMHAFALTSCIGGGVRRISTRTVCSKEAPGNARPVSRRAALSLGALATAALAIAPPDALSAPAVSALEEVVNDRLGYAFGAPTMGWTASTTTMSGMRDLLLYVKDGSEGATNVSMVGTPISSDFKKLTSFGTVENVTKTLVPDGQGGVNGKVISASLDTQKNAYVVEYTITPSKTEPTRHLITVFSLQPGRYLLTLTAQTMDDLWSQEEAMLRRVTDSYRIKYLEE